MPSMASTISSHNKFVLGENPAPAEGGCNCRSGADKCALNGRCLTSSLVPRLHREGAQGVHRADSKHLQAEVHSAQGVLQAPEPGTPHHTLELRLEPEIQQLPFSASWSIMKKDPTYSKETMNCQLCLMEKTLISLADRSTYLNKRSEIMGKCRHGDKWLLKHR